MKSPLPPAPLSPFAVSALLAVLASSPLLTAQGEKNSPAPEWQRELRAVQQDYEQRLGALQESYEDRIRRLESAQGVGDAGPVRRGVGVSGQTTIFDNIFNPAISLIGDFVAAGTDQKDSHENANRFILRDIELGIVGRVDPMLSYQFYLHFGEDEVEVEEAYLLGDDLLPNNFSIKAGRFNMDFGRLSPVHDHDLPFLDKPQVLQEFLGGSLRGTGAELHHNFSIGEATLARWSVGAVNALEGDTHAIFGPTAGHTHGHEEDGPEPFGRRNFDNLAFHGRVLALTELREDRTLAVGLSAAFAPEMDAFYTSGTDTIRAELSKKLYALDVTFRQFDQASGAGLTLAGEYLISDAETSDDGVSISSVDAHGFYAYALYATSPFWSFGVSGGRFEHAEDAQERSWDAGVFATHNFNEFNRVRLEARHFDDPDAADSWGLALQWTIILGSHGHGLDW